MISKRTKKRGKHQFCRIQKMSIANLSIKFVEKKFVDSTNLNSDLSNSTNFIKKCRLHQISFDKFYLSLEFNKSYSITLTFDEFEFR